MSDTVQLEILKLLQKVQTDMKTSQLVVDETTPKGGNADNKGKKKKKCKLIK